MSVSLFTLLTAAIYPNGSDVVKSQVRTWGLEVETFLNALASNHVLINGKIVASVNANVLTVAIKTLAGNDPSTSDPVYAVFRHATLTNGDQPVLKITAATSLTISAGSTLGASSGVNHRLWIVLFNDGGTARLGAVNLYSGGIQYPLAESGVASSTAEGGAGAADTAGVIYTGTAVSSKAFRILGFLSWETALATAGNYAAAPDVVAMVTPGVRKPGELIQRQKSTSAATASGTTTVPLDDTIPQNTEGDSYFSQAITPKSKTNLLRIRGQLVISNTAAVHLIAALFQDSTADALAAWAEITAANGVLTMKFEYLMLAGTTSATTFALRAGGSGAGTTRLNGVSGARIFGGVAVSYLEIEELMG